MATNTTNYSFKKPDESDFYDVQDQNGNWDMADEALKSLDTPTFEDYTGSTPVPAANTAIDGIKSKTKLSALMSNIKAAFKGACLIGHIVNNCVTNNPNLPLSAAQGKVLMDLYTRLNGDLYKWLNVTRLDTGNDVNDLPSPSLAYSYSTASHAPFDDMPLWKQIVIGACLITALEFITGCVVNQWLGWGVWDYSGMPGNVLGQICPQYILLWLPVSLAGIVLDDWLRFWWWGEERPHYKII